MRHRQCRDQAAQAAADSAMNVIKAAAAKADEDAKPQPEPKPADGLGMDKDGNWFYYKTVK